MLERPKTLRCAIYTRKSSEEGLEQGFNSLHAQREACEAYVLSQRHEGWLALPRAYDDGGFSGGTMERPALRALLADIAAREIDIVVVYKVDRLTRALADFAKIVEVFDAQGVSFVSVTQQFNTTSSMGRLTLNVLLSFAQFEREVTGERIRDKIAASKKKGLWMGGWVPIGYDRSGRTLTINETEAEVVRTIFRLYLELGNVRLLETELDRLGLRTKAYVATTGRTIGNRRFSRGHIYKILSCPLYAGDIAHKNARHRGQHPAIVDRTTWDAVQEQLRANQQGTRTRANAKAPSLLAGLLFDAAGNKLVSTHARKNGKHYRYYVEPAGTEERGSTARRQLRLPAAELEAVAVGELSRLLSDGQRLIEVLELGTLAPGILSRALTRAKQLGTTLPAGSQSEQCEIIQSSVARVDIRESSIRLTLQRRALLRSLLPDDVALASSGGPENPVVLAVRLRLAPQHRDNKLILSAPEPHERAASHPALLKCIARGHVWFEQLASAPSRIYASPRRRRRRKRTFHRTANRICLCGPDSRS